MQAVSARQLQRKFGPYTAVDDLTFDVEEGEVFGLLGPNGAGKTTTIRLLSCLIYRTAGSAAVCGFEITEEPCKIREMVGVQTENPCLYERLTTFENLDFFAQAFGISNLEDKRQRIRELLEFFNLWDDRDKKVDHLSKGMKQKLALARALVHKPKLLLLDEPTANLDPESAAEVRTMISQLSEREGRTVLLSTHHLEDAEKLCDRVMIVNRGVRVTEGTPQELLESVGDPVVEVTLRNRSTMIANSLRGNAGVKAVALADHQKLVITLDNPDSTTPDLVAAIVRDGGEILSVKPLTPSLEDAYLQLLGRNPV